MSSSADHWQWIQYLNDARAKIEGEVIEISRDVGNLNSARAKIEEEVIEISNDLNSLEDDLTEKLKSNKKFTEKLANEISNIKKRIKGIEEKLNLCFAPQTSYINIRSLCIEQNAFQAIQPKIEDLTHQYAKHNIFISYYQRNYDWEIAIFTKENKNISIALDAFKELELLFSKSPENPNINKKRSKKLDIPRMIFEFFKAPHIETKITAIFITLAIGLIVAYGILSAIISLVQR